jgi:CheY-like chemotaxis protein
MKIRAIVFEDDESSLKLITLVLERKGYEVIGTSDPTLCPIYSNLNQPCPHEDACGDFLLTDNRMPRMTGLDFIAAQSRRGCKGIVNNKAVISSSWTPEERKMAKALGCKIFKKPYRIKEISEWLDEAEKKISNDRKLVVLDGGCDPGLATLL